MKTKKGKGVEANQTGVVVSSCIRLVRKGLSEEVPFEQRHEWSEGATLSAGRIFQVAGVAGINTLRWDQG